MRTPLLVTLGAVLSWAALLAASRVLLVGLALDPWAFSFVQLCAGGIVLIAAGGIQRFELSSFRRPSTWILGTLRVLSAALYTAVIAWVSVLEAGVLGAVNIPMVAVAVWAAFGRRPARGEWLGHLAILAAILLLVAQLEGGVWHPAVGLMLLNEVGGARGWQGVLEAIELYDAALDATQRDRVFRDQSPGEPGVMTGEGSVRVTWSENP